MTSQMAPQRKPRFISWFDDARRDVAYGARTLGRAPGFTVVAIATLALGIGAATVIYSLLHNVLLEPFPYTAPRRMVDVVIRDASNNVFRGPLPPDEFLAYQQAGEVFEDVAGTITQSMHYQGATGAERMSVGWGTPNMFAFLGVQPLHGRYFGPADAAPDAPPVAVLNHRTWQTIFAGDPGMVGRTVTLNDTPRTVIGIMPRRFEWHVADFWIPAPIDRAAPATAPNRVRWFQARLRPGVTTEQAEAQLKVMAARRAAEAPKDYPAGSRVQVITIIDWVAGQFRFVLYTLFGAVTLLLVIACCNVANMLLARATRREQEMTVRAALGASRSRIVRQLLVESLLLAAGGLAAGCLLAFGGIALLARLLPRQGVAWEVALKLDLPVLAFALAAAATATLVFGVVPAWQAARRDLLAGANSGGRSGTGGRRQHRLRSGLVVAEVGLSLVLLVGAGLLARSFIQLTDVDLGLGTDPNRLLAAGVAFPPTQATAAAQGTFWEETLGRVRTIPGVTSVAVSSGLFGGLTGPFSVPGVPPAAEPPRALIQFGSDALVETLGLRIVMGRALSSAEVDGARHVALINQTLVRQQFGGASPIGRMIRLDRLATPPVSLDDPTFEIVGVVNDVANAGVQDPPIPHVYVPYGLRGPLGMTLLVKTAGEAALLTSAVRQQVQAVNPRVAVVTPRSVASQLELGVFAQPRFSLFVLLLFAATGLGLVALGVYGVISYTVSQQTREFAIRMALGGDRRHVVGQVLRMTLRLIIAGIVLGLAGGFAAGRLLITQLRNISPTDPMTFATAVGIVVVIGAAACAVPARRATRVEPAAALRQE
jgi:predicted permease